MFAMLLLMMAGSDNDVATFKIAPPPIKIACLSGACGFQPQPEDYRVPSEPDPLAKTSKDRAFAADGTKCSVVGDKWCTSRGRKIFSTDFTE